jgi:VanZ family protein
MQKLRSTDGSRLLGVVCLLILLGILVAGLWPFWPSGNDVAWLEGANGLRFGNYGTVLSSGVFHAPASEQDTSCSLEIWVQPGSASDNADFLSFSTPEVARQLSFEQYHDNFLVLRQVQGDPPPPGKVIGITGVFREIRPRFITITSGPGHTKIYVDGFLGYSSAQFLVAKDVAGLLVIGTAPSVPEHWWGQLRGVAIYDGELTAAQVLAHYEVWTTQGRPPLYGNPHAIAIYPFNEHAGTVVHNAVDSGIDLFIPKRFSLAHKAFLAPFWKEYRPRWSYWKDNLVNVAGFIPFGFFFFAYWSLARPIKHAALATVALGFAVSLTIEVLQGWLPTRASSTTDVITDTLGTLIGVVAFSSMVRRRSFLGSVSIPVENLKA